MKKVSKKIIFFFSISGIFFCWAYPCFADIVRERLILTVQVEAGEAIVSSCVREVVLDKLPVVGRAISGSFLNGQLIEKFAIKYPKSGKGLSINESTFNQGIAAFFWLRKNKKIKRFFFF
jgi:hypothetical protein